MKDASKDRNQAAADAVKQRGMETTVDLAQQPENQPAGDQNAGNDGDKPKGHPGKERDPANEDARKSGDSDTA